MRLGGDRNDKGRIAAQQCCLRHVPRAADAKSICDWALTHDTLPKVGQPEPEFHSTGLNSRGFSWPLRSIVSFIAMPSSLRRC
jgi:hypothetical protein